MVAMRGRKMWVGNMIFVFGSNLAGIHAGGAAKEAHDHFDAEWGVGTGPTGRAYAIPTMDRHLRPLPLDDIRGHVEDFKRYAAAHPRLEFFVTAVGCGIAGYRPDEIAPMFADAPANCTLHRRLVEARSGA